MGVDANSNHPLSNDTYDWGDQTPTREIEMYVGVYEGNAQTWFTDYIDIPCNTPEDKISEVAGELMQNKLVRDNPELHVAFVGVYCIPEDDDEDD